MAAVDVEKVQLVRRQPEIGHLEAKQIAIERQQRLDVLDVENGMSHTERAGAKAEIGRPGLKGSDAISGPWNTSSGLPAGSLNEISSETRRSSASAPNPRVTLTVDIKLRARMNGREVARAARNLDASFPVVYMTGAAADE